MQMSHRRKTALASSAMVLASVLSSCGFDYATDREYPPGVGANDRTLTVDVLSAHIVSDKEGRGVFIASLANNDTLEGASLTSMTSEQVDVDAFSPIEIAPGAAVNLADGSQQALRLTDPGTEFGALADGKSQDEHAEAEKTSVPWNDQGAIVPGKFVRLTVQFDNLESTSFNVPVVANCGYYANIPGVNPGPENCPTGNDVKQEVSH